MLEAYNTVRSARRAFRKGHYMEASILLATASGIFSARGFTRQEHETYELAAKLTHVARAHGQDWTQFRGLK